MIIKKKFKGRVIKVVSENHNRNSFVPNINTEFSKTKIFSRLPPYNKMCHCKSMVTLHVHLSLDIIVLAELFWECEGREGG